MESARTMNERGRYLMNEKNSWEIVEFEEIGSTNDYAKQRRGEGRNLIVTAKRQTGGRGTKGRSFSSQEGGVYITKLTFYKGFLAKNSFQIMASAATAVCKTLRAFGLSPVIKWPNDIFVNDKKICGILIENTFSGNEVVSSVVGIGINVHNELEEKLKDIATTIRKESGKLFSVEEVKKRLISEWNKDFSMDEYRSFIGYLGREVTLIFGDERVPATLVSVDETGGLWVKRGEKISRVTAAEVSVRI